MLRILGNPIPPATVVLVALLLLFGSQFTLFAMWFDLERTRTSNSREPWRARVRSMSTCVVTGGAGFLGSHLCDYLLAEGHRVICVDNLETSTLENLEHIRTTSSVPQPRRHGAHRDRGPVTSSSTWPQLASPIDYLR